MCTRTREKIMRKLQQFCHTNRHFIMAGCFCISIVAATYWWITTSQTGGVARSELLFIMPLGSGIGLTLGWPRQWRTIWLSVLLMYLLTPFVSARIESCLLPINGQLPCFAELDQLRRAGNQSRHLIYFVGLIVLHTLATGVLWFFTHRQEARDVAPTDS